MKKIVRNRIKCLNCGDILESNHEYDFHICRCEDVTMGGGQVSLKRSFTLGAKWEEMSEFEDEDEPV